MHTARVILLSILAVGAAAACYQPPRIPRDKPLTCSSADPAECPTGFVCIANKVCAPDSCEDEEDCPDGLVCTRMGCLPPGVDAGGADAGGGSPADAGGGS